MRQTGPMGSRLAAAAATSGALALVHAAPSAAVLGTFAQRPPTAVPGGWCRWRWPGSAGDPGALALTIDDGPAPATTPRTLDLLDRYGMRATFFVVGTEVDRHPELAGEIRRRGHGLGVHGYQHRHHLLRSPAWVHADTGRAAASVSAATGATPRWYRPPYGQLTSGTVAAARRHGMQVVLWSRWGREFAERSAGPVVDRLRPGLIPGAVLLVHDSDRFARPGTAAITHRVLGSLAAELERRQLVSVLLDDLAAMHVPDRSSAVVPA